LTAARAAVAHTESVLYLWSYHSARLQWQFNGKIDASRETRRDIDFHFIIHGRKKSSARTFSAHADHALPRFSLNRAAQINAEVSLYLFIYSNVSSLFPDISGNEKKMWSTHANLIKRI